MQSTPLLDRTETLSSPINNTDQFNKPLKRSYTSSPLRSTTSNSSLSRTSSFLSEVDEEGGTRWTRQHWKKLEEYYIKKDRDIEKATSAFYYCESLIRVTESDSKPIMKELLLRRNKKISRLQVIMSSLVFQEKKNHHKQINKKCM